VHLDSFLHGHYADRYAPRNHWPFLILLFCFSISEDITIFCLDGMAELSAAGTALAIHKKLRGSAKRSSQRCKGVSGAA
jgi:hypothetical protein